MLGDGLLDLLDGGDAGEMLDQIEQALAMTPPKALERAAALYVWKKAWESALPASRRGGDRKSAAWRDKDQSEKISFSSAAAEALGLGERSIQLDVALAEALGPRDIRRLWTSPIVDNAAALKTVAALDDAGRTALFSIWSDNPKLGFGAAMTAARLRAKEDSDEAQFRGLVDDWSRAGSKARRRFLTEIGVGEEIADIVVALWRKRGVQ